MKNPDLVWESAPKWRYVILLLPSLFLSFASLTASTAFFRDEISFPLALFYVVIGGAFGIGFLMECLPGTIAFVRSKPFIRFSEDGAKCGWKNYRWDGVHDFGNRPDEPRKLVFVDQSRKELFEIDISSGANDDYEGAEEVLKRIISKFRKERKDAEKTSVQSSNDDWGPSGGRF